MRPPIQALSHAIVSIPTSPSIFPDPSFYHSHTLYYPISNPNIFQSALSSEVIPLGAVVCSLTILVGRQIRDPIGFTHSNI
jgi:hypothetical protein